MAATGTSTDATTDPEVRVCQSTGLVLVPFPTRGTWRVFKNNRPAVSGRPREGQPPKKWNRFDLPGEHGTVYSATTRRGALAEVLASFKPRTSQILELMREAFNDVDEGDDPITREWDELGHMRPGHIAQVWRAERRLIQLHHRTPPEVGPYVHIEHHESIAAISESCADLLTDLGVEELDVSELRSNDRELTCSLAEWISAQYLDDGAVPVGIRYASRHSTEWECWATIPPPPYGNLAPAGAERDLSNRDPDLEYVAKLFGLTFH
ncbi:RES domain-containing protein [Nocardioides sp. J2M5]|uniref:RES domain-containing protein n=1 Tax=Nocardioides palaemonis TaxID=2829810 RepID=UPI001BA51328|nr:RES domain-containing protein [Nocardioides palaemonis]MBS2936855.1 RES domain-containing protein [Nocardioides palaemonis]